MYTCNHCKKKFNNQPYITYSSKKKYCSFECVPDSAMNRPYSYEYFNFMDSIRDIEARIDNIAALEDRLDLENEIDELSHSLILETYGDDEGLFYKRQLILLAPVLNQLYSKIHNIFIGRKLEQKLAVIIYWDSLVQLFGDELAEMIFRFFESRMSGISCENVYDYDSQDLGCFKDKLCVNTLEEAENIKNIYIRSLNYFKSLYDEKQPEELDYNDNYISIKTLAHCVVCNEWEDKNDFTFDENLKLYKCNQWNKCFNYDNYYED
ncbi:hypothetical protein N4T77_15705 [Clostridium sp. CX1]|uniref:hypothetical protein n=1 Tax=Clostridium sp. CX1 TaxID=2978346 RepID=UPI0021BE024C|nr:hypothetical protein [Clostridium sp. CX1]MCT8978038.1 hypothetical protein [Clostridium sp. CX1]